jgi:hypothetical protein
LHLFSFLRNDKIERTSVLGAERSH